jgi:hypothetical protein
VKLLTMSKSHTRSLFSNMDSDPICLDETVSDFPHVFVLRHFHLLPARHSDVGGVSPQLFVVKKLIVAS